MSDARVEEILACDHRRRLFECIALHEGTHLRDISRRTMTPLGTTLYHLQRLEAAGIVVARRDGGFKRFFTANAVGAREKTLLSELRRSVPRTFVTALLAEGPLGQRELGSRAGVARSTVSYHLQELMLHEIVKQETPRRERLYALVDPAFAASVIARHAVSLGLAPARVELAFVAPPTILQASVAATAAPAGDA